MLKDFIKYVLFLFHFRDVVPARYINRIKIKENNEELAVISNDADLFFSESLQGKNVILRKIVYEKIKSAGKKYLKKKPKITDIFYIKHYKAKILLIIRMNGGIFVTEIACGLLIKRKILAFMAQ